MTATTHLHSRASDTNSAAVRDDNDDDNDVRPFRPSSSMGSCRLLLTFKRLKKPMENADTGSKKKNCISLRLDRIEVLRGTVHSRKLTKVCSC
jgi:hypothetical protein